MSLDAQGAEHLFERIERLQRTLPELPNLDPEAVAEAVEPWSRAVAGSNRERFARRLAWDGIQPDLAALALVETSGSLQEPWYRSLEHWLKAVRSRTIEQELGPIRELPFGPLLAPWVEEAAARVEAAGFAHEVLLPRAWVAWKMGLARRLHWAAAGVLWHELELERSASGRNGAYSRLETAWHHGSIIERWPLLGRYLTGLCEDWLGFSREWLRRLEQDLPALQLVLAGNRKLGQVTELYPGLSDPHEGGRRVLALRFEGGVDLVYKPRSVALEGAWYELLQELRSSGISELPPAARVLVCDGYGWMERVTPEPLETVQEVESWFRRAGALTALTWVLGARDLHAENILAAREGPVLVDAEMLLGPGAAASTSDPISATGLLPQLQGQPKGLLAGFEAPEPGALSTEERIFRGSEDELECQQQPRPNLARPNLPLWEGRRQTLAAWGELFREGFAHTARELLSRRELLRSWLNRRASDPVRVVFRPSQQYAMLLTLSVEPRYLRQGITASLLREALLQPLLEAPTRPALWSLVRFERFALERLDIPVFHLPAGSRRLTALDGATIEIAPLSALERAQSGLEQLDESAIAREQQRIESGLRSVRLPEGELEARLLQAAGTVLRELARSSQFNSGALGTSEPFRNLCLYDGLAGRALFAAVAAHVSGDSGWKERASVLGQALADKFFRWIELQQEGATPGVLDGWGGIVWALSWLEFLDPSPSRREKLQLAGRVLSSRSAAFEGPSWDLSSGAAGAILGALASWQVTGERSFLDLAREYGSAIRNGADLLEDGAQSWPVGPNGTALAGMAHGASGIARALDALAEATQEPAWAEAAGAALAFERRRFDPVRGDWGVPGQGGQVHYLAAWCHGAGGVLAVRALRARAGRASNSELQELQQARATLAAAPLPTYDHFCCGSAGRIAAMSLADALESNASERRYLARELAYQTLVRAEARGSWQLEPETLAQEGGSGAAGLFRGYPGLVWALVGSTPFGRQLPWLAVLELPEEWRARTR